MDCSAQPLGGKLKTCNVANTTRLCWTIQKRIGGHLLRISDIARRDKLGCGLNVESELGTCPVYELKGGPKTFRRENGVARTDDTQRLELTGVGFARKEEGFG